jgi:putative SOS response-associated peptidase YedK
MGSVKQPYCFEVGEGDVFAFAGLWDQWKSPDGQIIESCTILTTTPNSLVADLHDRMPVIVAPDKYDVWLDPDVTDFDAIRDILKPYDATLMRRYPVSRKLNNSRIDDAEAASPYVQIGSRNKINRTFMLESQECHRRRPESRDSE